MLRDGIGTFTRWSVESFDQGGYISPVPWALGGFGASFLLSVVALSAGHQPGIVMFLIIGTSLSVAFAAASFAVAAIHNRKISAQIGQDELD